MLDKPLPARPQTPLNQTTIPLHRRPGSETKIISGHASPSSSPARSRGPSSPVSPRRGRPSLALNLDKTRSIFRARSMSGVGVVAINTSDDQFEGGGANKARSRSPPVRFSLVQSSCPTVVVPKEGNSRLSEHAEDPEPTSAIPLVSLFPVTTVPAGSDEALTGRPREASNASVVTTNTFGKPSSPSIPSRCLHSFIPVDEDDETPTEERDLAAYSPQRQHQQSMAGSGLIVHSAPPSPTRSFLPAVHSSSDDSDSNGENNKTITPSHSRSKELFGLGLGLIEAPQTHPTTMSSTPVTKKTLPTPIRSPSTLSTTQQSVYYSALPTPTTPFSTSTMNTPSSASTVYVECTWPML